MRKVLILLGIMALSLTLIACGNADVNTSENTSNEVVENTANEETPADTNNQAEATESETSTGDEEVLAVDKRVPNYELTTLDGETVSLHDYDGKIILLNFWATW